MHVLTLLVRAYDSSQLGVIGNLLKASLEGLEVDLEVRGASSHGWVHVAVSGEDENTALNCLIRDFGRCPEELGSIERFASIRGRISSLGEAGVSVDVGVAVPRVVEALVPLVSLQAQLVDGRKVALRRVAELFGFREGLPLTVKAVAVNVEEGSVGAVLAEGQRSLYGRWIRSLLDRLIVLGPTFYGVESALDKAGLGRDVVGIESLGLLEHAVVCKFGTDAAGLVPKLGRRLHRAAFSVFDSERIFAFLQGDSALLAS
jgi:hypothetical protein